jgi:hypothetical protein
MEMAPGAIPHPSRVPKQRLLSPELVFDGGGAAGTFHAGTGFSRRRHFLGGRAMSESQREPEGPTPHGGMARGGATPPYGVAASWLGYVSPLESAFMSDK